MTSVTSPHSAIAEAITPHLSGVAETAMVPLYMRYLETLRGDRILKDLTAVEMVRQLSYDFSAIALSPTSHLTNLIATRLFDYGVMHFLETAPDALVINLGAGLCSRFQRIDNGTVRWYDVDLPEVNQIRAQFFTSSDRYRWLSQPLLSEAWLESIEYSPQQPVLIVMEGVSMFLPEKTLKQLFQQLQQRFNGVEVLMDVVHLENLWHLKSCQVITLPHIELQWSLKQSRILESWGDGIEILEENFYLTYLQHFAQRFQSWNRRLIMTSMPLIKNANRLLRIRLQGRCPP